MWLLTNFGFFSVVQKPDDGPAGTLTVRSRVKSDLEALREKYLPSMGPIVAHAGTDYEYRAKASREALAVAMLQIALDLDYSNFKNSVAMTQGHKRADIYHKLWEDLWALQDEEKQTPAPATTTEAGSYERKIPLLRRGIV